MGHGRETLDTPLIERCPQGSKPFRLSCTMHRDTPVSDHYLFENNTSLSLYHVWPLYHFRPVYGGQLGPSIDGPGEQRDKIIKLEGDLN